MLAVDLMDEPGRSFSACAEACTATCQLATSQAGGHWFEPDDSPLSRGRPDGTLGTDRTDPGTVRTRGLLAVEHEATELGDGLLGRRPAPPSSED